MGELEAFVEDKELDIASTEALFSCVDLWAVILLHRDIVIAIIILIRAMIIIDSPCIRLDLSKLAGLLLFGAFEAVFLPSPSRTTFDDFVRQLNLANLDGVLNLDLDFGTWPEQARKSSFKDIGRVILKYPAVKQAVSRLLAAANLKYKILVKTCNAYAPEMTESALAAVRVVVKRMADESGMNDEILAAKAVLGRQYLTLRGLRSLQRSGAPQSDADEDEQIELEDSKEEEAHRVWTEMSQVEERERRKGRRADIFAITLGAPHSPERELQIALLVEHATGAQRNRGWSAAPQPAGPRVWSSIWRHWLGGLGQGVSLKMAAAAHGRMADLVQREKCEKRLARVGEAHRRKPPVKKRTTWQARSRHTSTLAGADKATEKGAQKKGAQKKGASGKAAAGTTGKKGKKAKEVDTPASPAQPPKDNKLFPRMVFEFNICKNGECGRVWLLAWRSQRNAADHACQRVKVAFDARHFANHPSVLALTNNGSRQFRQNTLYCAAQGFLPITRGRVHSVPVFYAHHFYSLLHLSPADLPPELRAYPSTSIIPTLHDPLLPPAICHALERCGLDLPKMDLGPIIDVADEQVEDLLARREGRAHQVIARLVVALGGGSVLDGTVGIWKG
ncbi:hypothetical protein JCM10213v2_008967 [Rhodosporidiobolus nylandii]